MRLSYWCFSFTFGRPVYGSNKSVCVFSIKLMCTGLKNAEIKVEIHLHVSTHKHRNVTMLKFRRNKICLKGKLSSIALLKYSTISRSDRNRNTNDGHTRHRQLYGYIKVSILFRYIEYRFFPFQIRFIKL